MPWSRSPGSPLGSCWHSSRGFLLFWLHIKLPLKPPLLTRVGLPCSWFQCGLYQHHGGGWSHYSGALVKVLTLHYTSSDIPLQEKVSNASLLPHYLCVSTDISGRGNRIYTTWQECPSALLSAFSETSLTGCLRCLITAWWQWKTRLPILPLLTWIWDKTRFSVVFACNRMIIV